MSSSIGNKVRFTVFGESHSEAIGAVIEGIPAGIKIDMEQIQEFMKRRAPGRNDFSTKRKEADIPQILSGILDGTTCGTPIAAIIKNTDTKSKDYSEIKKKPRPSHADLAAYAKYGQAHDIRGGGHFSGRLTAPICFVGALCMQILENMGITIAAHIASIGDVEDRKMDHTYVDADGLINIRKKEFPVLDDNQGQLMKEQILEVKKQGDSIGGSIECFILGVKAGVGEPMFEGIENKIAQTIFGIPAIKSIEFGAGVKTALMKGSEYNDPFYMDGDTIKSRTNNSGGILGGISNGMPIVFKTAIKPTPSISMSQDTIDIYTMKDAKLKIHGRHDPCIVPRAVPCIEAAAATAILDLIYERQE